MTQVARNLTDVTDGFLKGASYLIHDRDPLFTNGFVEVLKSGGVTTVRLPARSPNLNPHAERFVKSIRYECLNKFILFGEKHVRYVVGQYVEHYHRERHHQALGGRLLVSDSAANDNGSIQCRERLGGLLRYYYRDAS